jgi:hypothetical protein
VHKQIPLHHLHIARSSGKIPKVGYGTMETSWQEEATAASHHPVAGRLEQTK